MVLEAFSFVLFTLICNVFTRDVTIQTQFGSIIGEVVDTSFVDGTSLQVTQFLGIPYAEPPTGTRRFQRSEPKINFPENIIAKSMPPMCLQNSGIMRRFGINPDLLNQSEDCLYMNIYIPGNNSEETGASSAKYPVMVWLYPGKWEYGFIDTYEAKAFVGLNNVILVLFNHRNSVMGYLSTGKTNLPGNYGLWDQHLALKWVHTNIADFGGNSENITVFGESTGASSAIFQAMFKDNEGVFKRIIAQSGSVNIPIAYDKNPMIAFNKFVNKSNCSSESHSEIMNCLHSLSLEDLKDLLEFDDEFAPVVDGELLPDLPVDLLTNKTLIERLGKFDLIIGLNSAEGGLDIPKTKRWIKTNTPNATNLFTKEIFETIIVPFAINRAKLKSSVFLQEAMIHKYIDWANPEDTDIIFQRTIDLFSDIVFNAAILKTTMAHSSSEEMGSVYFYLFDFQSPISDLPYPGAQHFDEVGYVLGFPPWFAGRYPSRNLTISQTEMDLSRAMMKYWTNFAKTG